MKRLKIMDCIVKKRWILMSVLGLCSFQRISAQETPNFDIPNYAPKSPEAAAFLQYGQYPVNLSTGVPGISIPVYTVDIKDYRLPITLDYHAAGIKVTQEASWVGLGWNLNYGAQIVLSVRDDVDGDTPLAIPGPQVKSFYETHPYEYSQGTIKTENLDKSRVKDVYVFSSPTANGEFYYDTSTNDYIVYPPDAFEVKIVQSDIDGNPGAMFRITDSSGNIYKLKTFEYSFRAFTHHDYYTSAWYADEIVTPNIDKIKFIYEDDGVTEEYSFSDRVNVTSHITNCNCPESSESPPAISHSISGVLHEGGTTNTFVKKIKEIVFNAGQSKLVFIRTSDRLDVKSGRFEQVHTYSNSRLSQIQLYTKTNINSPNFDVVPIKRYFLSHSYFNASASNYMGKRLKLDNVLVLPQEEGYEFKYNTTPLPIKNSRSQDYYGYYNGHNNSDLIPAHTITSPYNTTIGSADRTVDEDYIKAGILTEIKYPTKGWTKFNYEVNTYFDPAVPIGTGFSASGTAIGVGSGGNNVEGEENAENPYTTVCPDTCVQYTTLPFFVHNPLGVSAQIYARVYNTLDPNDENAYKKLKGKYGRVRVFDSENFDPYDTGTFKNVAWDETTTKFLQPGPGLLVIEAWGDYVVAQGSISFNDIIEGEPVNSVGAGLRVASIESYDHNSVLVSRKEYSYVTPGTTNATSGRLVNPALQFDFKTDPIKNYSPVTACAINGSGYIPNITYDISYDFTSVGKYGIRGEAVMYEYVKETNVNVIDSTKNGYTQYKFTTGTDWYNHLSVIIPTSWKRGKIWEKSDYKTVGDKSYILRREVNNYIEDNAKFSSVKGFKFRRSSFVSITEDIDNPTNTPSPVLTDCGIPTTADFQGVFYWYEMQAPWYYLKNKEVTETFYTPSNQVAGELKTNTIYSYNNPEHMQLSSEVTTASNGETLETKYYYSKDTEVSNLGAVNQLNAKHMLNVPIKVEKYRNGEKIEHVTTIYKDWGSGIVQQQSVSTTKGGALPVNHLRIHYTKVEPGSGNVLELNKDNEGIFTSYIYGYGNRLPVAKLENCAYANIPSALIQEIKDASDSGDESLLIAKLNNLRQELPSALITSFTYEPLKGVATITDPRFITTSYSYDHEARLTMVKDYLDNLIIENIYHYKP